MAHLRLSSVKVQKHFRRTKDRTQTIQSFPLPLNTDSHFFKYKNLCNSKIRFWQKIFSILEFETFLTISIFSGPEMILYRIQRWKINFWPLTILTNGHFRTKIWTFNYFLKTFEVFGVSRKKVWDEPKLQVEKSQVVLKIKFTQF